MIFPNTDRFSQPMDWEGRDFEREEEIELERGDMQNDLADSEPTTEQLQ